MIDEIKIITEGQAKDLILKYALKNGDKTISAHEIQKEVLPKLTQYDGPFIYEGTFADDATLKFINHSEGYIQPDNQRDFDYVYQYKDHLGNIRLSYSDTNNDGTVDVSEIIEENNYYPFGLEHKGYNNVINGTENKYQTYQGQELEEELGKNTLAFQWRDYDPAIARFNKIDRFSEKYYDQSPYNFTKNSPMVFQEVKGDSVRVAQVTVYDNVNSTNYQQQLVNDWQQQTGLTLNVDATGLISYATDANGNAVVSTTTDANGNTTQNGSASARADLVGYIDGNGVTDIGVTPNDSVTPSGGNQIWLGDSQITSFINGTPAELNDRTLGVGMTAFHEFRHTGAGGSNSDPTTPGDTSTGPVVDRVNVYRQELDNNPSNAGARPYGQRRTYQATPSGSNSTIGFRYQTTNRRGRTVRRSRNIRF